MDDDFTVDFHPGQNAIIGVNGSGKSTLINIALRCLTGPANLPAATSDTELGQVRPRSVAMARSDRQLFGRRVADGATKATAKLLVALGPKTLEITRNLSDLSLQSCLVSDRLTEAAGTDRVTHLNEDDYQAEAAQALGVGTFFDALIIFHFLVFMMEDRRSLVWDPTAQRQVFRVLMLPPDRATEYAKAQQDVISRDSAVRNTSAVLNRHKGNIQAAKNRAKTIKDAEAERRLLSREAGILRDQVDSLAQARVQADKERQSARLDRLKASGARESIARELERIKIDALGTLLSPSQETLRYIVWQLVAEHKCLVCGTDPSPIASEIEDRLRSGACPVCGSKHAVADKIIPLSQAHRQRIGRLEAELKYADDQIAEADQRIAGAMTAFANADNDYDKLERRRLALDARIVEVLKRIPAEKAAVASRQNDVDALSNILAEERRALKRAETRFRKMVSETVSNVEGLQDSIATAFQRYINVFLKEDAALVYQTVKTRVGQGGATFDFPEFKLSMSAGAVAGQTLRDNPNEVSQSQAEFVDLAFRMALMAVAADGGPAALVVDAPEASLDFLFAERAGHQLAAFSKDRAENRVVVTSYLPSAHLLNAFFEGIRGGDQRRSRIVDLIQGAAPNAAVRADRHRYEAFLEDIIEARS